MKSPLFALFLLGFAGLGSSHLLAQDTLYQSSSLQVIQWRPGIFQHVSYLDTNEWGKVPCNGLVVAGDGQALIADTPPDSLTTVELMEFITNQLGARPHYFVPNHFHDDCVGGMRALQAAGVITMARLRTQELLREAEHPEAAITVGADTTLWVGDKRVVWRYSGAGHTEDNTWIHLPDHEVAFLGCLSKSATSQSLGYLGDAVPEAWYTTMDSVLVHLNNYTLVVPGHGRPSGWHAIWNTQRLLNQRDGVKGLLTHSLSGLRTFNYAALKAFANESGVVIISTQEEWEDALGDQADETLRQAVDFGTHVVLIKHSGGDCNARYFDTIEGLGTQRVVWHEYNEWGGCRAGGQHWRAIQIPKSDPMPALSIEEHLVEPFRFH